MKNIFVSYSRLDAPHATAIVQDLEEYGHNVWLDQHDLVGGQLWWSELLEQIRQCDVYLPVLSNNFLDSEPCQQELNYAVNLGRPMLPVFIEAVSNTRIVPQVAQSHWLDYREPSKRAALQLVKAIDNVPLHVPLPDPLPPEPDVPVHSIYHLEQKLQGPPMTREEQLTLLDDLKAFRRDGDLSVDELLRKFQRRTDTIHTIALDIEELLRSARPLGPEPPPPDPVADHRRLQTEPVAISVRTRILLAGGGILMLLASFMKWWYIPDLDIDSLQGTAWNAPGSGWSIGAVLLGATAGVYALFLKFNPSQRGRPWGKSYVLGANGVILLLILKFVAIADALDALGGQGGEGLGLAFVAALLLLAGSVFLYREEKQAVGE